MKFLLTGDLHLTDRPKDNYRFGLFKWMAKQQKNHKVDVTFILGDLTDSKDKHSSLLVNKVVDAIGQLDKPVVILKGNHDYINPDNPFFRFLEMMKGVFFISSSEFMADYGVALCPHVRQEVAFRASLSSFNRPDYLFIHNTIDGSVSETGGRLSGFSASPIEEVAPRIGCYAGDVHRPQMAGPVTYLGSPYTIRFGDNFEPRVLLLDGRKETNLYYDCTRKWALVVRGPEDLLRNKELLKGDQVKLIIEMAKEEAVEWKSAKADILETCSKLGLEVYGVSLQINAPTRKREQIDAYRATTPADVLTSFCASENIPTATRDAGLGLL